MPEWLYIALVAIAAVAAARFLLPRIPGAGPIAAYI